MELNETPEQRRCAIRVGAKGAEWTIIFDPPEQKLLLPNRPPVQVKGELRRILWPQLEELFRLNGMIEPWEEMIGAVAAPPGLGVVLKDTREDENAGGIEAGS